MKKSRFLVLTALILTVLFCISTVTSAGELPFTDVKADSWYYSYVKHVYEEGVMNGKSETSFDPEGVVTRAEFLTMLVRASGLVPSTYSGGFGDVYSSDWFAGYVGAAILGIHSEGPYLSRVGEGGRPEDHPEVDMAFVEKMWEDS